MTRPRPRAVAFDVVETLMSLEPLREQFARVGLPATALERWFDRMLRDAMALTLAGDHVPFPAVARGSLQVVGGAELDDDQVQQVLEAFGQLPAQPDAEPAIRALVEAGVTVACVSNGARQSTQAFLERSGLDDLVAEVVSVDEVGRWKPAPEVYRHTVETLRSTPEQVALVAVHAFDCHGAHAADLTTGWASRLEQRYADVFHPADVEGEDLVAVAERLLALPAH